MAGPTIDQEQFYRRLNRLYDGWKENEDHVHFGKGIDAFCILAGKAHTPESTYRLSAVTQMYLLGFLEFPDTLMIFTKDFLYVLTSGKKYALLEAILPGNETSTVKMKLLNRNKRDGNKENFQVLINVIKESGAGKKVGMLLKEKPVGDLTDSFKTELQSAKLEQVEVSKGLELCISVKEEVELENIRWAAALSSKLFKGKFIEDMETIIDEEKKVKMDKMARDLEAVFDNPTKIKVTLSPSDIESCYPPIIQSGGNYDLRPNAQTKVADLKYDVITCSLGARFKGYCSNVARTFFIDPTKSMERTYELLLEAQELCISELRPGVSMDKVVVKVQNLIRSRNSRLSERLTKNLGFGIGLEFRESSNVLTHKNQSVIKEGMVFNVAIGFENVPISASHRKANHPEAYSVFIADTVAVLKDQTKSYTKVSKSWTKVHYDIEEGADKEDGDEDDEDEDEKTGPSSKKKKDKKASIHGPVDTTLAGTRNQLLQSRLRDQQRQLEGKETDQERREKHQVELMKRKREEAMRRMEQRGNNKNDLDRGVQEISAYESPCSFPKGVKNRQMMVDMKAECVLVPINGIPVPFHISTIKNVSKSEEDKATFLRINFYAAGVSIARDCSPAMQAMISKNENKMFIKELGFRSVDAHNLNLQFRLIKELQKRVKQRLQQEKEESDLVLQEALIVTKDRRVPRLLDLSARPVLAGRKTQGTLEAHSNGLRFKSLKNETLDILYANIKHAIFQPCDKELVVLVHFHLKHHIMIGKKKQRDVQFYTEVMDASQNLDSRRRSMYDPDELDEENRERALRAKLNQTFKEFCKKVEQTAERSQYPLSFDIPYRELGFQGTPFKEMVLLQPTVNCLMNLTENPFFIVALDEIEHVHFERVMFSSRNFDLAVVLKNFDLPPIRISAIPMTELDSIKEWLDDIDLCFTTGTANLNWKAIMATIKMDDRFYLDTDEDGVNKPAGWEFLKMEGSDDDDDDEEDAESNYSEEDGSESEDESEESEDSDLESLVSENDSEEFGDEDDDAPSWDELEREAAVSDRKRGAVPQDDEEKPRKKKKRH